MKAVLHYRATPGFRRAISTLCSDWLHIAVVDETDKTTFAREMQDAEVLLHVLEPVKSDVIYGAAGLRLIQKLGVGVDTIDLEAARRRQIAVCNMPGTNTRAVAELALALMLSALRRVPVLDAQTRAGKGWVLDSDVTDNLGELGGRTVGLVGFGAVGRCLAPMLNGIGSRVISADVAAASDKAATRVSLQELLATSDVVSLHVPLTAETTRMINEKTLALMKTGAVLVNTARGGLVDYEALHESLRRGHLRAAALDVFDAEPVDPAHPLLRLPNIVVTPHLAWFTAETLNRSLGVFVENCRRLRDGEPLLHRIV